MNVIEKVDGQSISFDEPEICPQCKHALKPQILAQKVFFDNKRNKYCSVLYLCNHCYRPFIGHYQLKDFRHGNDPWLSTRLYVEPNRFACREFDFHISALSPDFVRIYNQALAAESSSLDQIAGVGYRKALEFLIKDYLIHKSPEDKETIKKMLLGNCIANKVENENIKDAASCSTWLGNDQTHYEQLYSEYDLKDMKTFIDAVVYWILMELITEEARHVERRR